MPLTPDQLVDRILANWRLRIKAWRAGVPLSRELVTEAIEHRHDIQSLESTRKYLTTLGGEESVEERFRSVSAPQAVWLRGKAEEYGSTILIVLSILSLVIKLWELWRDRNNRAAT